MTRTVRTLDGVSIIDLHGKITIGKGDVLLREAVHEVLDQGRRRILINLAGVSYMDSCGLGELAACCKTARSRGADIKLLNPSRKVFDLLQMIQLEELIESYRDEQRAVRSFRTTPEPTRPMASL